MVEHHSFYHPHVRVTTDGTLVNPKTGEVYTPTARTKQSFVAECDINNILKQFKLTGQIRHMSAKAAMGTYEDLPDPQDFQESMNIIIAAEASFATLPSQVRARFGNDPTNFLEFMGNPSNQDEIVKLGLGTRRPEAAPPPAPPPSPPPTPPGGQNSAAADKK